MAEHHEIRAILPQRYPLLLVDRVLEREPGRRIRTVKAVTAAEPCYRALPETAVAADYAYPASLLIESMGQSAALLWLADEADGGEEYVLLFVGARDVRLTGAAYPGDTVTHVVHLDQVKADTAFAHGESFVDGRRIATVGTLMAARRPRAALSTPDRGDRATPVTTMQAGNEGRLR
jgi:3-hydroxyacyl-[acyl-carrier-protein] dehydratase